VKPLVFVVDDDLLMGPLLDFSIQAAGCDSQVFQNPLTALEAVRTSGAKPALIVSDVNMPEMNGLELLKQCRALLPGLKTVVLGGSVRDGHLGATDVAPDAVLEKPVDDEELTRVVRSLLGLSAA